MKPTYAFNPYLALAGLLCLSGMVIALLSQHAFGMRPCAWCVLQRLILLVTGLACGMAVLGRSAVQRTGAILALALSASGMLAAWYQYSVAAHSFSCAQTFADRLITGLGLDASLPWLFGIYASCMDARVSLLGVEYAIWGLLLFAACALLALLALWHSRAARQWPPA